MNTEVTLPLFAAISARLEAGYSRQAVLATEGMPEEIWLVEQRRWLDEIGRQVAANRFQLLQRYLLLLDQERRGLRLVSPAMQNGTEVQKPPVSAVPRDVGEHSSYGFAEQRLPGAGGAFNAPPFVSLEELNRTVLKSHLEPAAGPASQLPDSRFGTTGYGWGSPAGAAQVFSSANRPDALNPERPGLVTPDQQTNPHHPGGDWGSSQIAPASTAWPAVGRNAYGTALPAEARGPEPHVPADPLAETAVPMAYFTAAGPAVQGRQLAPQHAEAFLASAPASLVTAHAGGTGAPPAAFFVASPPPLQSARLTLEQYAYFHSELVRAANPYEVLVRFGLDVPGKAEEDQAWQVLFAQDSALYSRFLQLYYAYYALPR